MCNVDGVELPESTAQLHHVVHNPNQTCSSFVMRPGSVLYVGSGCTPWSLCHARCDVAGVVTVAGAAVHACFAWLQVHAAWHSTLPQHGQHGVAAPDTGTRGRRRVEVRCTGATLGIRVHA